MARSADEHTFETPAGSAAGRGQDP
jgi:hypothetical protein